MPIGAMDVGILDVTPADNDFAAGNDLTIEVRSEVGQSLFDTKGVYRVVFSMTSLSNPSQLNAQSINGTYGDARWPAAGRNTFAFTVPGPATTNRGGELAQAQAAVIGGSASVLDGSHAVSATMLLT